MSQRPVALLVCLVAVEAARYGDYSGARMPHYSIEYENKDPAPLIDEYSDRLPDAVAAFDYKYEEEPRGKIDAPEQNDAWENTSKKRKKPFQTTNDRVEIDENEPDIVPKFKSNHRFPKHRTRIKDLRKESNRRHYQYDRNLNDDIDDVNNKNDYKIKDRLRDDNRIDLENFDFRDTTRRVARRKPRDKTISHERLGSEDIRDDQLEFKGKESDEDTAEIEYEKERRLQTTSERPHVSFPGLNNVHHKNYKEYDEYYDMKRVNNIRNKLPGLFRQTKASTSMAESPSMRRFQDITYRRANVPEKYFEINTVTDASSTQTTLTSFVVLISQTTAETEESIPTTTDLSLAEKSRLSILKKAQRKESLRNVTWTTKPPVLMQVTKKMQTLVMVEPAKQDLNFRARAVFDDSPERIARAKKLMRRKLVAGARSIHDLIDNWDEMICDYIDVSLLDNGDDHPVPSDFKIILLSVINCLISKGLV